MMGRSTKESKIMKIKRIVLIIVSGMLVVVLLVAETVYHERLEHVPEEIVMVVQNGTYAPITASNAFSGSFVWTGSFSQR